MVKTLVRSAEQLASPKPPPSSEAQVWSRQSCAHSLQPARIRRAGHWLRRFWPCVPEGFAGRLLAARACLPVSPPSAVRAQSSRTFLLGDTIEQQYQDADICGKVVDPSAGTPKFEVEPRGNTKVEMCRVAREGLFLATINTLNAISLNVKQCVVSCFNYVIDASCPEVVISPPLDMALPSSPAISASSP